jgi:two-component system nitrogen regulation response regulator GlnG
MNPASKKILIADDDSSIRLVLSQAFTRLGYQVRATGNASTLLKWAEDGEGDLILTDVMMPDENVFNVLPRIRKERPKLPIIVMSAQNTLLTAVNAADAGAFEYISKPFDLDDITAAARRALSRPADSEAAKAQARAMKDERLPLIGRSAAMQEVYRTVARLVGADLTVLILGESGTGKELVARALHDLGRRRDGRFVVINLAAVPRDRVETELFGRGEGDLGKLVEADGGTLFLDEIGDMPLDAQSRLLRVIDGAEPAINPRTSRPPNVRIIAATNRDLRGLIQQGLFREDLFFRLNVAPVRLPPLRDRVEDIPDLARSFLLRAAREGLPSKTIDQSALDRMKTHDWPGNVRELENLMERICLIEEGPRIRLEHLPQRILREVGLAPAARAAGLPADPAAFTAQDYHTATSDFQRALIRQALAGARNNLGTAAHSLGLSRHALRHQMVKLGLLELPTSE